MVNTKIFKIALAALSKKSQMQMKRNQSICFTTLQFEPFKLSHRNCCLQARKALVLLTSEKFRYGSERSENVYENDNAKRPTYICIQRQDIPQRCSESCSNAAIENTLRTEKEPQQAAEGGKNQNAPSDRIPSYNTIHVCNTYHITFFQPRICVDTAKKNQRQNTLNIRKQTEISRHNIKHKCRTSHVTVEHKQILPSSAENLMRRHFFNDTKSSTLETSMARK
jgi:hypothetical protein